MRSRRQSRAGIQERFIDALRWFGDAGAEALIDCWDALDDEQLIELPMLDKDALRLSTLLPRRFGCFRTVP